MEHDKYESDEGHLETHEETAADVTEEKPRQKRQVSEAARKVMLENLAKAREVRAAKRRNVTKYPKHKRERAVQMYQQDVESAADRKVRLLAEEMLKKKEEEKEIEQFRKWKATMSQEQKSEPPKPDLQKRKKTPVPKRPVRPAAAKSKKESRPASEPEMMANTYPSSLISRYGSVDLDQFLE